MPHPSPRLVTRPTLLAVLLIACLASVSLVSPARPASAATCDTTWVSTGFDNWSSPGAWDHGVPTATTNACIPDLGGQAVQVSTSSPVAAALTVGPNVVLRVEGVVAGHPRHVSQDIRDTGRGW